MKGSYKIIEDCLNSALCDLNFQVVRGRRWLRALQGAVDSTTQSVGIPAYAALPAKPLNHQLNRRRSSAFVPKVQGCTAFAVDILRPFGLRLCVFDTSPM